ncbi:MAG: hypothetical protein ACI857_001762 [Arenicella sp.]|jgi:hypothetical protein
MDNVDYRSFITFEEEGSRELVNWKHQKVYLIAPGKHKTKFIDQLPFYGILIFIGLYAYSSGMYPGGSQADAKSVGFDWINNYWCNLTSDLAMNGESNPARPYAISALIILCCSFWFFFWRFAQAYLENVFLEKMMKACSVISMLSAILIFTSFHDSMTIVSSAFGLPVLIALAIGVYKKHKPFFKWMAIICIVILGVNNYIYYSKTGIEYLPLLQKVSFFLVLQFIIGLNYEMAKLNYSKGPVVTIKGVKTADWNAVMTHLKKDEWYVEKEYSGFDKGIDYDSYVFKKNGKKIVMNWDN